MMAAGAAALTVQGLPIMKPPYGMLAAINLDRGEVAWQTPHGDSDRNHPALKGMNIPTPEAAAPDPSSGCSCL